MIYLSAGLLLIIIRVSLTACKQNWFGWRLCFLMIDSKTFNFKSHLHSLLLFVFNVAICLEYYFAYRLNCMNLLILMNIIIENIERKNYVPFYFSKVTYVLFWRGIFVNLFWSIWVLILTLYWDKVKYLFSKLFSVVFFLLVFK